MRILLFMAASAALMLAGGAAQAQSPGAAQRMAQPGPEQRDLAQQVGTWDVTATMWPAPGAAPIVMRAVAERKLVGSILQEEMHAQPGSGAPDFTRLDYLDYDRVEGRWKYVSMDTRFPVSIMPAWSFGGAREGKIRLQFEPLGFVGFGPEVEGRFMSSDMVISRPDPDHVLKEQHVIMANGTGAEWLFVRYDYARRR